MFEHLSLTYYIPLVKGQSSFYEIRSLAICINIKVSNRVNRKQFWSVFTCTQTKWGDLLCNKNRTKRRTKITLLIWTLPTQGMTKVRYEIGEI